MRLPPSKAFGQSLRLGVVAGLCLCLGLGLSARAEARPPATLLQLSGATAPTLDARRAALVIIDAQNDYLDGVLPLAHMDDAIQEIVRLRLWARKNHVLIVHVRHQSYPEPGVFGPGRGSEIVEALTPVAGESVVVKSLPNAFAKTGLDALLHQAGRDQLILTGFMTHMCLDSTTRAALDHGYTSFVVASATADRDLADLSGGVVPSEEVKRASLAALADRFAWIVPDADALEAELKHSGKVER